MSIYLLGLLLSLPVYLAGGISVARLRYDRDLTNGPTREEKGIYQKHIVAINSIRHRPYCSIVWWPKENKQCDCDMRSTWAKHRVWTIAPKVDPTPKMSTIVTWPVYLLGYSVRQYVSNVKTKALPSTEFEVDEVSGASLPPAKEEFEEVIFEKNPIYRDPLSLELEKTWKDLEAMAIADMEKPTRGRSKLY